MSNNNNDDDEEPQPMSVEAMGFCESNPNWRATTGVDGALKIWNTTNCTCRQVCRVNNNSTSQDATTNNNDESPTPGITRLQEGP